MNDRFCLNSFPCFSLTLCLSFLRFRYHLLEPQEPWFPAVDMWMKNDVNINRVESWLFDLTWIGFGSEGRSQKAPLLNYALLLLVYCGFILYMMYTYIYIYIFFFWYNIYCNTLNSANAPLTLAHGLLLKGPFSKSGVVPWRTPKVGSRRDRRRWKMLGSSMHVSCPWFKKRKTVLWHYGPWIFIQTSFLKIIAKWWWDCCYVGAILPGWEPRVASGEDKEVGGQFP